MKHIKQKFLSVFLALCMVLTLTPTVAFAAENNLSKVPDGMFESGKGLAGALSGKTEGTDYSLSVDGHAVTLTLRKDVEMGTYIGLTGKEAGSLTIDLAGHRLTSTASDAGKPTFFNVTNGTVTIKDTGGESGEIVSNSTDKTMIKASGDGGTLKIEGGNIKQTDDSKLSAIFIENGATATISGNTKIVGNLKENSATCSIKINSGTLTFGQNSDNSSSPTVNCENGYGIGILGAGKLIMENGTVTGGSAAIVTNGSGSVGAEIDINGGTVTGTGQNTCGVYLPVGQMTVNGEEENPTISGPAGIVVRGGTLTVNGGTIKGTGNSNNINVGDAEVTNIPPAGIVYNKVEGKGYPEDGKVEITGGTVEASKADQASVDYTENGTDGDEKNAPITISGGTFLSDGKPDAENIEDFLEPTVETNEKGDVVPRETGEASIETTSGKNDYYESLKEAIDNATTGDTVYLEDDIALPGINGISPIDRIEITDKKITIDLNEHTVNKAEALHENHAGLLICNGGDVTLKGTGTIAGKGTLLMMKDNGKLTIEDNVNVTQTEGADTSNNSAIDVNGTGTLDIQGGTITAEESGIGVFSQSNLKMSGGTINAKQFGISANGSETQSDAKIDITGGTITSIDGTGVYLPAGSMTVSGNETKIEGLAGIVVRSAKLTIAPNPTIISTTTDEKTIQVGDVEYDVPTAAVVVDNNDVYSNGKTTKTIVNGGSFKAQPGHDSVVYTTQGKKDEENKDKNLEVSGGAFSSRVIKSYLNESLTAELNSKKAGDDTPYSYYNTRGDALKAAEGNADAIVTQFTDKAYILKSGFLSEGGKKANDYLNGLAPEIKGDGEAWDVNGGKGIDDCADNTFYAAFHAAASDADSGGATYTVKFTKEGSDEAYTESVEKVKEGGIVYFTPSYQTDKGNIPERDFQGEYTAELFKGANVGDTSNNSLDSYGIKVYQITYKAGTGVKYQNDTIRYADVNNLNDSYYKTEAKNLGFTPTSDSSDLNVKATKDDETFTVTVEVTSGSGGNQGGNQGGNGGSNGSGSSGVSGSSATVTTASTSNGSFSVSNRHAKAGDTVTVTPKPNDGYIVDEVTVTDKNGNSVAVKDNGDGTYSFVMPEKAAQPVKVSVTFKEETDDTPSDNPSSKFVDVIAGSWYQEAVDYVIANGLMQGTSETTFEPATTTTRGMVVTVLHRMESAPSAPTAEFGDVTSGQWYSNAVAWAAEKRIVTGYDNGNFGPNDMITREQLATMLYRYAAYKAYSTSAQTSLAAYTDADAISGYAQSAMNWANAENLITGTTTTTLSPQGDASRAELATILMRFCEQVAK